jgi:chromosome segregation ATPase
LLGKALYDLDEIRAERDTLRERLRQFLDGYHLASEEINRALGTNEEFERIDREMFECQQMGWARHVTAKVDRLKAERDALRAEVEEAKREWDRADRLARERGRLLGKARAEVGRLREMIEVALHVPNWREILQRALAPEGKP